MNGLVACNGDWGGFPVDIASRVRVYVVVPFRTFLNGEICLERNAPMIITLDLGQVLTLTASAFGVVAGVIAFARFIKWWWHKPPAPGE